MKSNYIPQYFDRVRGEKESRPYEILSKKILYELRDRKREGV